MNRVIEGLIRVVTAPLFSAIDLRITGGAVTDFRTLAEGRFEEAHQTNNPDGSTTVFVPTRATATFLVNGIPVKVDDYKYKGGYTEVRHGGTMDDNRMVGGEMVNLDPQHTHTTFQVGDATIEADYHK